MFKIHHSILLTVKSDRNRVCVSELGKLFCLRGASFLYTFERYCAIPLLNNV
jgi:hypothetical protein